MRKNNEKISGFRLWMTDIQMTQVACKSKYWHPSLCPSNSIVLIKHWNISSKCNACILNLHTVTIKWRCKAHLQCTKRHNYALHSVAFIDTSRGYGQQFLMYCLPSTNLLMYPFVQFMHISEEKKTLTSISFLGSNLNSHIHTFNSLKNKCHVTLYDNSDCRRSVFIILFVWFMWLNASVVVNEDASPVSWWVHFTDIPDSYSAMFSQHRALWNHCMNPRIPTSLVVCNLNRRNSWHS